ncbi:MAG: VCBS repeat-containing protein [Nibricoccus sp.]
MNRSRFFLRAASIFAGVAQGFSAAQPAAPAAVVTLRGPEVVKLDWNTRALQVADINGDGLADLAVANNDHSAIEILYQLKPGAPLEALPRSLSVNRWEPVLEDARFRKASITTGVTVFDFVVGDLNGDGRADLAYTGDPQTLTIRYQQTDGTWQEKKIAEAPEPIQFVGSLRLADVNGDKRQDLVVLGQKEIAVFEQQKNGELAPPDRYALPDDGCYGLELTDVNGDGRLDFVYLRNNTRDGLRVRLQTAAREFGPELAYAMKPSRCTLQVLSPAQGKTAATFAFAQEATGQLEVFRLEQTPSTTGGPVLRPRVFSPRSGSKNPACYALGDFNGDKRLDIAVGDPDGAQVYLYLRQPDGGFTSAQRYPVSADVRSLAAADWDGDGQDELFIGSPKEQTVGVAKFTNGRLAYPQPLPITGRPLGLAAGEIAADGRVLLAVIREEKSKRYVEVWARKDAGAELLKSIELTGLKTDPRAVRLVDANQDGRLDLAIFTPLDAMRLLLQGDALEFTDLSTKPGFRKGLVDNLEASAFTLGDIDGDGKSELVTSVSSFARAMRINEQGELAVVDQYNARDSNAEVASTLVLPVAGSKRPVVVLYDRKGEQFQILRASDKGLYELADSTPTGKIEVISAETRQLPGGATEAFIFGKDRFWWLPLGQTDYAATTVATHATDLPEISYSDVIAGDFNNDGRPEIVCVDPAKNLLEILSRGSDDRWTSLMHFKVFEIDQHYQGRKGSPMEPRETLIGDVTGDGKKDLILLVHDRVLIYPQE